MTDLIPTRDRIMALLSPPSQDVHLTVDDARWIKAEIERLRDAMRRAILFVEEDMKHTAITHLEAALEDNNE